MNLNETSLEKAMIDLAGQQQDIILESLQELIEKKILIVESERPELVRGYPTDELKVCQKFRLVLREKEYIQGLEEEIKNLKRTILSFKRDEN